MNVIEHLKWRYATKKFDSSKKLSEKKVNLLKEAFNLTPTSYGLQPIKLLVISNKKIQEKIREHSFNQRQVADASHLLIICAKNNITEKDINAYFDLEIEIRKTAPEIVNKFRQQLINILQNKTTEERKSMATKQAYIALGNLITVCALEKIDTCPMEGFNALEVDKLLNLPSQNLSSVLLLPVGYRAEGDFMSKLQKVRKPLQETVIEIS